MTQNPKTDTEGSHTPSVPAAERVLSILELVADTRRGVSLGELCRKLALPKSSCHCLIVTLERRGYLLRNPATHRYVIGAKLFGLHNAAMHGATLREQAARYTHLLVQQTGLTVHLAVTAHSTVILIDKVQPPGLLQIATWVGQHFDFHSTGVGKALLAYLPEAEFAALVRRGLTRHNENTITSTRRLLKDMCLIRQQGYAVEDEEGEIGFRCIGAAIFDHSGAAIAAVSVAGTVHQITEANLNAMADKVVQAAHNISAMLGHSSSSKAPPE